MKTILAGLFLLCSLLLIGFALLPASTGNGIVVSDTGSNFYSQGTANNAPPDKVSDAEDEDCMCKEELPQMYPANLTVDTAGNVVPFASSATATSDKPDLVPGLIISPTNWQVVPIYVDAHQKPGRLLYRFDALIINQGGTLDLYQTGANADTFQIIWPGGNPAGQPDPNSLTPNPSSATVENRSAAGAFMKFVKLPGHNHFHINGAYTYSLAGRVVSKAGVGFCMLDGYRPSGSTWFKPGYIGTGPDTWCAHADPGAAFVRMGISPGKADWYPSQVADQWIDITGLAPGNYALTGSVNPFGYIDESDTSNNTIEQTRTIPGAIANNTAATAKKNGATTIDLSGSVIAPNIPARLSASCKPSKNSTSCYIMQASTTKLTFAIASAPEHGKVSITSQNGLTAVAKYTADNGYRGIDSFTYTATDTRNLTSQPATAQITVR